MFDVRYRIGLQSLAEAGPDEESCASRSTICAEHMKLGDGVEQLSRVPARH